MPGSHCLVHVPEWGSLGMRLGNLKKCNPLNKKNKNKKVESNENSKKSHLSLLLTPSAIAWAIPNLGTFLTQSGLKDTIVAERWPASTLSVHFSGLSIQFRDGYFRSSCWICDWHPYSKKEVVILTINLLCWLQMSEPVSCMDTVNC